MIYSEVDEVAIEGNLRDLSLPSLVQVICLERHKAALFLERNDEQGVIYFDDGEITHASAGTLAGEEAFFQLVSWNYGDFQVRECTTIPRRTVSAPLGHLLMEGMRRIDEMGVQEKSQIRFQNLLSSTEIEEDSVLESGLISLLSKLEHSRACVSGGMRKSEPLQNVQILIEMVNQVIDYSEDQLQMKNDEWPLKSTIAQVKETLPAVRMLNVQRNRISDQIPMLIKIIDGNQDDWVEVYRQVCTVLVTVHQEHFVLLTEKFHSTLVADQWKETFKAYLDDLSDVLNITKL